MLHTIVKLFLLMKKNIKVSQLLLAIISPSTSPIMLVFGNRVKNNKMRSKMRIWGMIKELKKTADMESKIKGISQTSVLKFRRGPDM